MRESCWFSARWRSPRKMWRFWRTP